MNDRQPKVFVSHSSQDKPFVCKLVDELKKNSVHVWFDERELGVGDSIVQGISNALREADYLLVVLSENSVHSKWVQNELNSALMEQTSAKDIVVLPAVIDDCEVPVLLRDRIYADFRQSFTDGLNSLLRVFAHEVESAITSEPTRKETIEASDCQTQIGELKLAELRRRMTKLMSRADVAAVWFDALDTQMENDMQGRTLVECVIELLDRARGRNKLAVVIESICANRADLAKPLPDPPQQAALGRGGSESPAKFILVIIFGIILAIGALVSLIIIVLQSL